MNLPETLARRRNLIEEVLISAALITLLSVASLVALFYKPDYELSKLLGQYDYSRAMALEAALFGSVLIGCANLAFILIHPGQSEKCGRLKTMTAIIYVFLMALGVVAYTVLAEIIYVYLGWGKAGSFFLSTFITLIYVYVIFKLYYENKVDSPLLIWELVRFCLVGVVAALFDFSADSFVRFAVLKDVGNATLVTIAAVTCGFLVGVLVNYLCSIFMVYKSDSGLKRSKTAKGIVLFVGLSAVGLFIGIGLVALFYDVLRLPYPAVFVIRTLVVLVWNYVTRKIFIFR